VLAPEVQVGVRVGEPHRQPGHGRADHRVQRRVDVEPDRRRERQPTVDQDRRAHPSRMAGRRQGGDERPHRVAQQDHPLAAQLVGDREQVLDVLAETPGPHDVAAAGAPPQVGRDEPHRAGPEAPGELVGDRPPGQRVGGDAVRRDDQRPCPARGPGAAVPREVVHLQLAAGSLDPEGHVDLANAHRTPPARRGPAGPEAR
jgi:hypothetical protein